MSEAAIQSRVNVVPASREHPALLADTLRWADRREVESYGLTPRRAVWRSYRRSTYARTAFVDGEIAAMWGFDGTPFKETANVWLLTAPPAERVKRTFLRIAREEVEFMLATTPVLQGNVDVTYIEAHRLLEELGFTLSTPFPFGKYRNLFCRFTLRVFP